MLQILSSVTQSPVVLPRGADWPTALVPGLYVHIPFCFHKCHYCDFYSITRQTPERMALFVDLLLAEAKSWTNQSNLHLQPQTVFFGGGTPSLLPLDEMRRLIAGLREIFDFSQCNEWTVEANPATVTLDYCRMLAGSGVNRLSFGAQSFDRAELALLERHHQPDEVPASVEIARSAGFSRLNLDLIYALCGQTPESWSRSLDAAIALGTEHLSCYALTYEPNTPLAVRKRLGRVQAVEEDVELEMARIARARLLAAGLSQYEISNYSRPAAECRHNLLYWTGGDYIGLGPSAASHIQGWRWKNKPHLGEWERTIQSGNLPAIEVEHLSPRRRAGELAMLSLRLTRGIRFQDLQEKFGINAAQEYAPILDRYAKENLLEPTPNGVRLTPRAWSVADALAAEFLLED
ncbi:MAG: radical SAM family heme chaperone HemW [Tepidisphaeraceae bacterium]|jgi:oxygen-independent coproporphyrinogen-3 oxidase